MRINFVPNMSRSTIPAPQKGTSRMLCFSVIFGQHHQKIIPFNRGSLRTRFSSWIVIMSTILDSITPFNHQPTFGFSSRKKLEPSPPVRFLKRSLTSQGSAGRQWRRPKFFDVLCHECHCLIMFNDYLIYILYDYESKLWHRRYPEIAG